MKYNFEMLDKPIREFYMLLLEGKVSLYDFEKWVEWREGEAAVEAAENAVDAYLESMEDWVE